MIENQEVKDQLALQYEDRQFIKKAPVIIAVLANTLKDPIYQEHVISASLSIENLILAAESMGIGSCILSCFLYHESHIKEKEKTRQILRVPRQKEAIALISLGYKDENEKIPEKTLADLKDIIFYIK